MARALAALGLAAVTVVAGCGGGSSGGPTSSNPAGSTQAHPDGSGEFYVVEQNQGGAAAHLRLLTTLWGRLVDVYDFDPATSATNLIFREMVIGRDVQTDGVRFRLERNPVTGVERLTILQPFGTPAFDANFALLDDNLQPLEFQGGILTMVARNAAAVLVFNDLLEPSTINDDTIKVLVGTPPTMPFESRIFADRTRGDALDRDGNGTPEFYTTRIVVDFTVSELEAQNSQQPLVINTVGLPEANTASQANAIFRIPTREDNSVGQVQVLRNLTAHALDFTGNGTTDGSVPTLDVVRNFRSGGTDVMPPDPFNGFLPDQIPPQIVGSQPVLVTSVTQTGSDTYEIDFDFQVTPCTRAPETGDVLELNGAVVGVTQNASTPPPGSGTVVDVDVQLLSGNPNALTPGPALFLAPFEPAEGDLPRCFVTFSPAANSPPVAGVQPGANVLVRFSEPMDPAAFEAYRTFRVQRDPGSANYTLLNDTMVGQVRSTLDLTEYRWVPSVPLPHASAGNERYSFTLVGGSTGATDLAGNTLVNDLPKIDFTLDANAAPADTFNVALLFQTDDQDGMNGPEIAGQFLIDTQPGSLRPRSVQRFSAQADTNSLLVGAMPVFTQPIQTPIAPLGSHMQTVWRHLDVGFTLLDPTFFNLDVEHLAWAPFGGIVSIDNYDEFQIQLGHSRKLPDEALDNLLMPLYPNSGLQLQYASNYLTPPMLVHQRPLGYSINPLDAFISATGRTLMYWPLNRNKPLSDFLRFTWRDTRVTEVGAPQGVGADPEVQTQLLGGMTPPPTASFYPAGQVPTIGLPLLMEFRCYPDNSAFGLNGFQIALAINTSGRPDFRGFSTGGVNSAGQVVTVDPDNDPQMTGSFAPGSTPPGLPTPAKDNSFYYGQADFVVRVSVVFTRWFNAGSANTTWAPAVLEPAPNFQPSETQVVLAFRGATTPGGNISTMGTTSSQPRQPYGDYGGEVFFNGDSSWHSNISDLNGAQYIQARITFLANPISLLAPRVDALGLAAVR